MLFYAIFCISICLVYGGLQLYLSTIWRSLQTWKIPNEWVPSKNVTLIIPCRNEEKTISRLLNSLLKCTYDKELIEIIIIDDHSTDNTYHTAAKYSSSFFSFKIIKAKDPNEMAPFSGKKAAITSAINIATGSLILTIDADCEVGPEWISSMVAYVENSQKRIAIGPVMSNNESNWLTKFQCLDMAATICVTGAGIQSQLFYLGSGANLIYYKSDFFALEGYQGNENIASGDDVFLIRKFALRNANDVGFVKTIDALVVTGAVENIKDFLLQRLRWASKTSKLSNTTLNSIGLIVGFQHVLILANFLFFFLFKTLIIPILLFQILVKILSDFKLLSAVLSDFNKKYWLRWFPISELILVLYYPLIGFFSVFSRNSVWKGRET